MNKYKITLEYDGTNFNGWQTQKTCSNVREENTVQGFLEQKLRKIAKEQVRVYGSGRTDSGVHAKNQTAHFSTNLSISCSSFQDALNSAKRSDIWIKRVEKVPPEFHARFDAKGKKYLYCIINTKKKLVFQRNFFWRIPHVLDVAAMEKGSKYLIGTYDFGAFRASSCTAKNSIKTVNSIRIHSQNNIIHIGVHGVSFLQYMVRNIVGTLVEVGRGRFKPEFIAELIRNQNRNESGPTAPPQGLFLMKVLY